MIRRSLTAKVTLAALASLVIVAGLAGFGLMQLFNSGGSINRLNVHITSDIQMVAQFHINLSRAVAEGQTFALSGESESYGQALALMNQAEATLAQLEEDTGTDGSVHDPVMLSDYHALQDDRSHLVATVKDLINTIDSGDAEARQASVSDLEQVEGQLTDIDARARRLIERNKIVAIATTDATIQRGVVSVSLGFGLIGLMTIVALLLLRWQVVAPLTRLAAAAKQLAAGKFDQAVPVSSADEIGSLQQAFNTMSAAIREQTHHLEREITAAHDARQEAEQAQAQIAAQLAQIESQQGVIREMSVPVLPVTAKTLVMPLVGALDTERLRLLQDQALRAIERTGAHYLLLDITGVSVVDTQVARGLIKVTQAARLLGAEAILVGVRPEVAQSIVGLGIPLEEVTTRASLQAGIAYTLGQREGQARASLA